MKKQAKVYLFFAFLLFIGIFVYQNYNWDTPEKKELNFQRILLGKQINSVAKLIDAPEFRNDSLNVILLYSGYDCSTCVKKGYSIVKKLKSKKIESNIISSYSNISRDQIEYGYTEGYIWNDEHDLIRKELKFIPTPIIFIINKENKILNIQRIEIDSDNEDIVDSIAKTIL